MECRLNADTGAPRETLTFDIPASDVNEEPKLDDGEKLFARSPFLSIPNQSLIFDMRTRVLYEFPKIRVAQVSRDSQRDAWDIP